MNILSPSILSCDIACIQEQFQQAEKGGAQYLHVDVMDGHFVPNSSFGLSVVSNLRKMSNLVFDVHLMISNPEKYIEHYAKAGADIITFHTEAAPHAHRLIQQIHECGKKAGIALNPATDESCLSYLLDDVDMVLLMTVNPGFGGQKYISGMTEKIRRVKQLIGDRPVDLEVDGGIGLQNVEEVIRAGANVIVAGSAVFGTDDVEQTVKCFMEKMA